MTTYSAITSSEIDADSPITDALLAKFRDNPIAINEGATGAPYVQTAWHPYNSTAVGDGNTGRLWDFATDGAVIEVITPTFASGYEYRLRMVGLSASASGNLLAQFYTNAGAYTSSLTLGSVAAGGIGDGFLEVFDPLRSSRHHFVRAQYTESTTLFGSFVADQAISAAAAFTITKFKIGLASGGLVAGFVYLDRRRIYA